MRRFIVFFWLMVSSAHAQISFEIFGNLFPQTTAFSVRAAVDYTTRFQTAEIKFGGLYIAPFSTPSAFLLFGQLELPVVANLRFGTRLTYTIAEVGVSAAGRLSALFYGRYIFIERDELALVAALRLEPYLENEFFFKNYLALNGRWQVADTFTLYFALEQELVFVPKLEYGGVYAYLGGVWRVGQFLTLLEFDARLDDPRVTDAYVGLRLPLLDNLALQGTAGFFQTIQGKAVVWVLKLGVVYNR
jgi:hypothetical protein